MNCYNDFAYIYDYLISKDVDYDLWSNKILDICRKYNINVLDYLDIGCGTGNLTEKIAPVFRNVWCIDLSSNMLSEAEQKFRNKSLKARFICQNMIEMNLNRRFDLITCCLDSTNYILNEEDLMKYFKAVYNHLKTNGIFIFDLNSYYKLTEILGNNMYDYDDEKITYIWDNNLENEIVDMYLIFFVKQSKELYRRFDEHHRERAYRCRNIENMLLKCGFDVLEKMNDYTDKSITNDSTRIVYVVKRGTSSYGGQNSASYGSK